MLDSGFKVAWGDVAVRRKFQVILEKDDTTSRYVAYVPGLARARADGATPAEARDRLVEALKRMAMDGGLPEP